MQPPCPDSRSSARRMDPSTHLRAALGGGRRWCGQHLCRCPPSGWPHMIPKHLQRHDLAGHREPDADGHRLLRASPAIFALDLVAPVAACDELWTMDQLGAGGACHDGNPRLPLGFVQLHDLLRGWRQRPRTMGNWHSDGPSPGFMVYRFWWRRTAPSDHPLGGATSRSELGDRRSLRPPALIPALSTLGVAPERC